VPLTQDQLVKLATSDVSDPRVAAEARQWLDGLHRQEYNLRDILGRVLLAAERVSPGACASLEGAGHVDAAEGAGDGLHQERLVLEAIVAGDLARAESRPLGVTDNDVVALTRYLSDRIHNQASSRPWRSAFDRAQELIDAAVSEAARQRAHAARVATRMLEIIRDDELEPGAAADVLAALRERVEAELARTHPAEA
jgi:hypothetical protein